MIISSVIYLYIYLVFFFFFFQKANYYFEGFENYNLNNFNDNSFIDYILQLLTRI